ncbi:GIY-YIG nuclease family protein [Paenibacillus piri]|uniref:GIY-YIG nuclease family protein n=1 Tax=Paenibacillus piri TaxID=2547395 RepID=A0A4R5KV06_9BACL|nr:GIY-YIG nuclease family protein [Paenibacillus piri]TDF99779.1 GIY-YIG nuclease family protein [Paenibacillus piri]
MNRRKELVQQYKEIKTEAGVFQIRNTVNNKVFIGSTKNLKTLNGKTFALKAGTHLNRQLQNEWNEYGADAFVIETLEVLARKETGYFDEKDALKKLEDKWLQQVQPYGMRGYN